MISTTEPSILQPRHPITNGAPREIEVSVVMPCLNEAETLAVCIRKAQKAFDDNQVQGEVVIADNGSTDGSQAIAEGLGARVVHVKDRGYGNALHGGIVSARGRFVIMGDSDDSYDFSAIGPFVDQLRAGCDLVMGNRFKGGIMPGAMPWKHKWIGNPVLSNIGRLFFRCPIGDFHCGLRAFTKNAYDQMELQTAGMEYASEMVIKATLLKMKIAEVPIILHKDGRSRPPHLRSWRDGWRHLRFMLMYSPRWLFLIPGSTTFLLGFLTMLALWIGPIGLGNVNLDVGTQLGAGCLSLLGYQLLVFAVFTKIFAITQRLHGPGTHLNKPVVKSIRLESGLIGGGLLSLVGIAALVQAVWNWRAADFGTLDTQANLRRIIPGVIFLTLGVQTIFSSFFVSILTLRRRK